jgi:hypothetical protein
VHLIAELALRYRFGLFEPCAAQALGLRPPTIPGCHAVAACDLGHRWIEDGSV